MLLGTPDFGIPFVYAWGSFRDLTGAHYVVAGEFQTIGGVPANRIAKWSGSTWETFPLPPGFGIIRALCTFDDGTGEALYIGGDAGAGFAPVLKWTGSAWAALGSGPFSGGQVKSMHIHDDGRGPALYIAGYFSSIGGVQANSIARWDGQTWEALGAGIGFQVLGMASLNDIRGPSLFAAGTFSTAGGGSAVSVAQWVGCPNCYTNCDLSTTPPLLNINDFLCFMNRFAMGDPYANCDQSSASPTLNVNDFICFMNRVVAGCP